MGAFKPMVKMMTTEPSVELKLKKGGHVSKPKKMMSGGMMGALSRVPGQSRNIGPATIVAPAARSMARKRNQIVDYSKMMKEGGESGAEHKAEMKKMGKIEHELKAHEKKPASKAHAGLKTGGIPKSTKPGAYKTGGVVDGQGGYKEGGIIKTMAKKTTKVVEAKPDNNSAPTGDVKMGNAGGYKKGGGAKKHFATGGAVNDSGHAVAMPKKAPSKPVAISELSGTFKKGGRVC